MNCQVCGGDTKTIDTGPSKDDPGCVRRRHQCKNKDCGQRFSTLERLHIFSLKIIKRDGLTREPYDERKLRRSVELVLSDHADLTRIEELLALIKLEIMSLGTSLTISSTEIARCVMAILQHNQEDRRAYIRYACQYMQFDVMGALPVPLDKLPKKRAKPASKKNDEGTSGTLL
jgi:transcriptional regulator NrdR family protein